MIKPNQDKITTEAQKAKDGIKQGKISENMAYVLELMDERIDASLKSLEKSIESSVDKEDFRDTIEKLFQDIYKKLDIIKAEELFLKRDDFITHVTQEFDAFSTKEDLKEVVENLTTSLVSQEDFSSYVQSEENNDNHIDSFVEIVNLAATKSDKNKNTLIAFAERLNFGGETSGTITDVQDQTSDIWRHVFQSLPTNLDKIQKGDIYIVSGLQNATNNGTFKVESVGDLEGNGWIEIKNSSGVTETTSTGSAIIKVDYMNTLNNVFFK